MVYESGSLILKMHFDYHDLHLKAIVNDKLAMQRFQEVRNASFSVWKVYIAESMILPRI
jgi:hypothetical protein